jgi:hypothetical protein
MIIAPPMLPRAQATPQTGEGQLGQAVAMQKSTQSQAEWQSKYAMMLKYPNLEAFSNALKKEAAGKYGGLWTVPGFTGGLFAEAKPQ